MKILVVDNYDSFVYNIVHILKNLKVGEVVVKKNDQLSLESVHQFDKILLSPGPGLPKDAGLMPALIANYFDKKSILGICLGHQAIAEHFGAKLINLSEPLHGIQSENTVTEPDYLFENIPQQFKIGHYHSWVVEPPLGNQLEIISIDERNNIMGLRHKKYDLRGFQFHPESVLTEHGIQLLSNWIKKN